MSIVLCSKSDSQLYEHNDLTVKKSVLPPPYIAGPYEDYTYPPTYHYVPSPFYFYIRKLFPFPDQVHQIGAFRLRYAPDASFDILRALIPSYSDTHRVQAVFDLSTVDPRLWATLVQLYSLLPDQFAVLPIPLADKHISLLQQIPSTSHFSLVTILELPGCRELTDATIVRLKDLSTLCAFDASATNLSADGIRILASTLFWTDEDDGEERTRRGPWGLRMLRLKDCPRISKKVFTYLEKFPLLSVVDLRGTQCTPSSVPRDAYTSSPNVSFYYPTRLAESLSSLQSSSPTPDSFYSSSNVYRLHITRLTHPRRSTTSSRTAQQESDISKNTFVTSPPRRSYQAASVQHKTIRNRNAQKPPTASSSSTTQDVRVPQEDITERSCDCLSGCECFNCENDEDVMGPPPVPYDMPAVKPSMSSPLELHTKTRASGAESDEVDYDWYDRGEPSEQHSRFECTSDCDSECDNFLLRREAQMQSEQHASSIASQSFYAASPNAPVKVEGKQIAQRVGRGAEYCAESYYLERRHEIALHDQRGQDPEKGREWEQALVLYREPRGWDVLEAIRPPVASSSRGTKDGKGSNPLDRKAVVNRSNPKAEMIKKQMEMAAMMKDGRKSQKRRLEDDFSGPDGGTPTQIPSRSGRKETEMPSNPFTTQVGQSGRGERNMTTLRSRMGLGTNLPAKSVSKPPTRPTVPSTKSVRSDKPGPSSKPVRLKPIMSMTVPELPPDEMKKLKAAASMDNSAHKRARTISETSVNPFKKLGAGRASLPSASTSNTPKPGTAGPLATMFKRMEAENSDMVKRKPMKTNSSAASSAKGKGSFN